uniref:Uncharacterized protein n=1 Tax=Cacopsylla melanoneura TaxID=428564 RepID=A0A8D8R7T0_9HEMI
MRKKAGKPCPVELIATNWDSGQNVGSVLSLPLCTLDSTHPLLHKTLETQNISIFCIQNQTFLSIFYNQLTVFECHLALCYFRHVHLNEYSKNQRKKEIQKQTFGLVYVGHWGQHIKKKIL